MTSFPKAQFMALVMAVSVVPTLAQAQDQRFRVAFGPAATTGSGDANMALTASVGYRYSERFSFDVDLMGIGAPRHRSSDRMFGMDGAYGDATRAGNMSANWSQFLGGTGRMPGAVGGSVLGMRGDWRSLARLGDFSTGLNGLSGMTDGQTVVGTVGLRYELPVQGGRLRPYVGGGLGIARTDRDFEVSGAGLTRAVTDAMSRTGMAAGPGHSLGMDSLSGSESHTGMAASAGVGASLRVFKELSVDIDARYYRLDRSRNLTRVGGGVSYRF